MIVWRDGEFLDGPAAVSSEDRGWLVGDAVFETVLVDRGRPAFLDRHLSRLATGLATMNMTFDPDEARLRAVIGELAERNAAPARAAFRLTISRVGGGRGLAVGRDAKVQAIATLKSAATPLQACRAILSTRRRWTGAATNGFKCVGAYSENVLARMEASALRADEAIMLNEHGRVACASAANVFAVMDGGLVTPTIAEGALPGVARGVLIEEARRLGIKVMEAEVEPSMVRNALLLLTNSIAGVVSTTVGEADGAGREIAVAAIGAYGARLQDEFAGRRPEANS